MTVEFTLGMGLVLIAFGALIASSPYWMLREFLRSNDEELPAWMGDPQARKRRLIVILGVFGTVGGLGLTLLSVLNP